MPNGPGKYDDLCTEVRTAAGAEAAIVIVIGGNRGSGFSVQVHGEDMTARLPELLRNMADEIERSWSARLHPLAPPP